MEKLKKLEGAKLLTPALDLIPEEDWMLRPLTEDYDFDQLAEIDDLVKQKIWITADKRKIPVKEMTTSHIINAVRCWEGFGKTFIPDNYLGGREKWLEIFDKELTSRM